MAKKKKSKDVDKEFSEDIKTQLTREVEIDDVKVRPYTFGQFLELTPILERIYKEIEEREIFKDGFPEKLEFKGDFIKLYMIAAKDMIKLISLACPEATEEEIKEWPVEKGMLIMATIFYINLGFLKNISALFTEKEHLEVRESN